MSTFLGQTYEVVRKRREEQQNYAAALSKPEGTLKDGGKSINARWAVTVFLFLTLLAVVCTYLFS